MPDMNVAHIGWLASSHVQRRAEALKERGVNTLVFTDSIPPGYNWREKGLFVEVLPETLKNDPQAQVLWLEARLAAHNVDLMHIHSTHFPASLGFFCENIPRITSIWDFVFSKDSTSPLFHKVILDELFRGRISEYVSFSSRMVMEQWLARGFPKERAFWHSWGVDLKHFSPRRDPEKIKGLRESLSIEPDEKIIFSPRTPSLQANVDLLLQALPRLRPSLRVRCVVTGHHIPQETRYHERLIKDVRDKILFLDPIRDKDRLGLLYQAADVVVSLHSNDHNPATVLEAMACGATLIVNESETVEYWVGHGRNGLTAKTRDLHGLASLLEEALTLPDAKRREWGEYNREKIEAEANFEKTMDQVIADYRRVLKTRPNGKKEKSLFHKGLALDIAGQYGPALEKYLAADRNGTKSAFLEELILEKQDLEDPKAGMDAFHSRRAEKQVLEICALPREKWERQVQTLPYPKSLYFHDYVAGLHPLVKAGRIKDYSYLAGLISAHFHTDEYGWLAESVRWFGNKWSLWNFCADLLLECEDGGTSLAIHALEAALALGPNDSRRVPLLEKALAWTAEPLEGVHPDLDKTYRKDVHEDCMELLSSGSGEKTGPANTKGTFAL